MIRPYHTKERSEQERQAVGASIGAGLLCLFIIATILLTSTIWCFGQPPLPVDSSQAIVAPEPPQTFLRRAEWFAVNDTNTTITGYWVGLWNTFTNFDALVSNTNGRHTTNLLVPVAPGTNYYAVRTRGLTNYSVPRQTNWFIWTEDRVKYGGLSSSNVTGPFATPLPLAGFTNPTGIPLDQHLPFSIMTATKITVTNGRGLP